MGIQVVAVSVPFARRIRHILTLSRKLRPPASVFIPETGESWNTHYIIIMRRENTCGISWSSNWNGGKIIYWQKDSPSRQYYLYYEHVINQFEEPNGLTIEG